MTARRAVVVSFEGSDDCRGDETLAEAHEMTMTERLTTGEERWVCARCERHTLVSWVPRFRSRVIEAGDEAVAHIGGKGGAKLATVSVHQVPSHSTRDWLHMSGIDWDGLAGPQARSA